MASRAYGERRVGLGVEGGHARHDADKHAHRVRVVVERAHELREVVVEEGVAHDLAVPVLELELAGELAVDAEEGDLEEGRLFSKLLDGVAAVAEDAAIAIDEADLGASDGSVLVRGIVHDKAFHLRKGVGLNRPVLNRHLISLLTC